MSRGDTPGCFSIRDRSLHRRVGDRRQRRSRLCPANLARYHANRPPFAGRLSMQPPLAWSSFTLWLGGQLGLRPRGNCSTQKWTSNGLLTPILGVPSAARNPTPRVYSRSSSPTGLSAVVALEPPIRNRRNGSENLPGHLWRCKPPWSCPWVEVRRPNLDKMETAWPNGPGPGRIGVDGLSLCPDQVFRSSRVASERRDLFRPSRSRGFLRQGVSFSWHDLGT